MLSKVKFKNFHSFGEECEISFRVGKKPSASYFDIALDASKERLNKVIAVLGPNGAGKTQMLKPMAFLGWFVSRSMTEAMPNKGIPFNSHALCQHQPTCFEIDFWIDNNAYRYKLEATPEAVIHESLHQKTSHLYSYLFVRDKIDDGYAYKQKGFGFPKNLAVKVRSNASIISSAHMYDVDYASKFFTFFRCFISNISVLGKQNYHDDALLESADFLHKNKDMRDKVNQIVCDLDLGISNIKYKQLDRQNKQDNSEKVIYPFGVHQSDLGEFELPFYKESSGTKSAFVMLSKIIPLLESGGIAIIDEIDNDLHPHMLPAILELFKFEHTNPHHAQLIFTCHTSEVLNQLKKHQLYLVEKDNLFSGSWRLDEIVGLRADDNVYAKYQSGALGAVPNV